MQTCHDRTCARLTPQLLPVNDTNSTGTWKDSYPYAPVSVFALHPIYVNLRAVGELAEPLMEQITAQRGAVLCW